MINTRTCILIATSLLCAAPATAQQSNSVGLPNRGGRAPDGPVTPGRPLATNAPTAPDQKPAFDGQVRAPAVFTRTPISVEVKTENLDHPWGLAFLGDGKLLVSEKPGAMRIVDMATGKPVAGVSGVPTVVYGGDAGLLDVVADPAFARNRTIYFTYVEPRGEHDSGVVVAKARLQPPKGGNQAPMYRLEDVTVLLRVDPAVAQHAHYGSRLVFDRAGFLFVSLGERFFLPTRAEAQSTYSWLGKVLRIDTEGKPAPGNPFDRDQDAENHTRAEIWSYGHRNPQGLAINPVDGELWDAEHGPDGGDEVNHVGRGANFGWPLVAYGTNYDRTPINGGRTQMPDTVQPRYVWEAAVGPGGMTFYAGDLIPEWRNNLFVAAMTGQHLARLVIEGDKVVGEERLLQDQHQRIRHVAQGPDGALWVIKDAADGRLLRLFPR
ncbi:PQQ-dependent sugar dehydrogenase [Methylobacterium sp. 37f]|uniref:PQQ-dependent sugar dehydrogenase n=1 Tax=Methylobacterium sp. 37f TaxID=2817058 RepID=UPI001FFD01FD|nr:PQQ-dependent sugar dehydrogenase [Methylobacterium sp. 37f]MCK2056598.1 PQQ-dependent sugar dehydrogenase [Methylobacterium sp. 37f]